MRIRIITCAIFSFFILQCNAQNNEVLEEDLIGRWKFIKFVDKQNKPFYLKDRSGKKIKKALPDWVFKKDGVIVINPDHKIPLTGYWKWISTSQLEITEEILPKDSFRIQNSKNIKTNESGNYILKDTLQIQLINKNKIKINTGGELSNIFKKN